MDTKENDMFSSCYGNLYSKTEEMADYSDVLNEELHKTTGLNECKDFTEDNTEHIDSRVDDRENTADNHIGDVMEMIEINVKESQNNDQLNDDGENYSAKHDYSKDEKTTRCVCEVADDKNVYVNNRLEYKTENGEKDDSHPMELNKRSAELDKYLPKKDRESFATNKSWKIKGRKMLSISKMIPHRINTTTEMIQNSVTNLTCTLFYIPKYSRKEQPENIEISTKMPFEECHNFTTYEPHLSISKPYPRRMSPREYKISLVDMSYNIFVRKAAYSSRRISENKVPAPLRHQRFSYSQNNNNSTNPKSKQRRSRSQQYNELEDLQKLAELVAPRSAPQYTQEYYVNEEPSHLDWYALEFARSHTLQPHSSQYEYYVNVDPYPRRGPLEFARSLRTATTPRKCHDLIHRPSCQSRKSLEDRHNVEPPHPYQISLERPRNVPYLCGSLYPQ